MRLALDFGTTNSAIAYSSGEAAPTISLIPSLLTINRMGQPFIGAGADANRLFRNFKRGIVASQSPAPRQIDGKSWSDRDAGEQFLRQVLSSLPFSLDDIEQLVLTAPVLAYESYLEWLTNIMNGLMPGSVPIQLVDESTAAALGYAVTEPGAIVLVFDFGGGTLDLSLVQLPDSKEKTGGMLGHFFNTKQHTARVIAKAGRMIGGSDIDQWMLAEICAGRGLENDTALLARCEQAKIALSSQEETVLELNVSGRGHTVPFSRAALETLLERHGFYEALRYVIEKVMIKARREGIFKEDIHHVLLVGGVSLMPSVQATLRTYFSDQAVHADKPFTAVVEGALQIAAGCGLNDYLNHSYGIRHFSGSAHHYEELIPAGTRYPMKDPVDLILGASYVDQKAIELVIGEIASDATPLIEVAYEDGRAVFVSKVDEDEQQIVPLNETAPTLIYLTPAGKPGKERIKASFWIDDRRHLCVSVIDLKTHETLLNQVVVATLR